MREPGSLVNYIVGHFHEVNIFVVEKIHNFYPRMVTKTIPIIAGTRVCVQKGLQEANIPLFRYFDHEKHKLACQIITGSMYP